MKRFLMGCTLAVALLAMSEQKASAWSKFNFGVGLNIGWEKADNSWLWGFYRNGPVPGSDGHGVASTITWEGKGSHSQYQGGNGGYFQGDVGSPATTMPYAPPTPTLPAPANSAPAVQQVGDFVPAAYWAPSQAYYWMGY
jgi:hypothetical protein